MHIRLKSLIPTIQIKENSNATDTNYFTTILQIANVAKLLLVFI